MTRSTVLYLLLKRRADQQRSCFVDFPPSDDPWTLHVVCPRWPYCTDVDIKNMRQHLLLFGIAYRALNCAALRSLSFWLPPFPYRFLNSDAEYPSSAPMLFLIWNSIERFYAVRFTVPFSDRRRGARGGSESRLRSEFCARRNERVMASSSTGSHQQQHHASHHHHEYGARQRRQELQPFCQVDDVNHNFRIRKYFYTCWQMQSLSDAYVKQQNWDSAYVSLYFIVQATVSQQHVLTHSSSCRRMVLDAVAMYCTRK